jgi:hypothetical protein
MTIKKSNYNDSDPVDLENDEFSESIESIEIIEDDTDIKDNLYNLLKDIIEYTDKNAISVGEFLTIDKLYNFIQRAQIN